jgi:hypothetical protein
MDLESTKFTLIKAGELYRLSNGLGADVFKEPIIDDDWGTITLERDDVVMVLQASATKWVKVLSRHGVGWMYRFADNILEKL